MSTAVPLSSVLRGAGVDPQDAPGADPAVTAVTLDSRRVVPGAIFVAAPGLVTTGERFIADALGRGAAAVIAAPPRPADLPDSIAWVRVADPRRVASPIARELAGRPDEALALVGITGTNGKTTVAWLVEGIARAASRRAGRIGTVGWRYGEVEGQGQRTTPEGPELWELLARMRDAGVEIVAMEVSSHALALHRVAGAGFAVAAFLNLGRDHLDFHADVEAYFEAKATLFDQLRPGGTAVIPADDARGERLRARARGRGRILTFGRVRGADVRVTREHVTLAGSRATLETPAGALDVELALPGAFNLDNAAAATAVAIACELPLEAIARGLAATRVPGRMERVDAGQPFEVLVDYAHTEAALDNLLAAVRPATRGRVIVVFGCGGERDRGKRSGMGRIAARGADLVFLTSDNPRGENPERILDEIAAGVAEVEGAAARTRRIPDRREAIRAAIAEARAGDAVVVAGRGHEALQETAGRRVPFDDRAVCREALHRPDGGDRARA